MLTGSVTMTMDYKALLSLAIDLATSPHLNADDRASAIRSVQMFAAHCSADEVEQCKADYVAKQLSNLNQDES